MKLNVIVQVFFNEKYFCSNLTEKKLKIWKKGTVFPQIRAAGVKTCNQELLDNIQLAYGGIRRIGQVITKTITHA